MGNTSCRRYSECSSLLNHVTLILIALNNLCYSWCLSWLADLAKKQEGKGTLYLNINDCINNSVIIMNLWIIQFPLNLSNTRTLGVGVGRQFIVRFAANDTWRELMWFRLVFLNATALSEHVDEESGKHLGQLLPLRPKAIWHHNTRTRSNVSPLPQVNPDPFPSQATHLYAAQPDSDNGSMPAQHRRIWGNR